MKILSKTLISIILVAGFCLIISPQSSLSQNTSTILILPFEVQADSRYDFLKPALADMLFTRLSAPGRTLIVEKHAEQPGQSKAETITLTDAIQIGQQKGADYIVTGRVLLQDGAFSTNADFIGIDEQRALVAFTQKGKQPGDIITQIDNFTAQVNADILNPGASTNEQTSQSEAPDDIHQHPEKLDIPEISPGKAANNEPTGRQELRPGLQPLDNR